MKLSQLFEVESGQMPGYYSAKIDGEWKIAEKVLRKGSWYHFYLPDHKYYSVRDGEMRHAPSKTGKHKTFLLTGKNQ